MTALNEFDRLETEGFWRETTDGDPRDVVVSFGRATLVICDTSGTALTHWSLAAVERINPGVTPALFAPDTAASETLEISDESMIGAVEKVRDAIARAKPQPNHLRHLWAVAMVAIVIAAGVYWGPQALVNQTLSAVPASKRTEIGATILGHYQRLTGTTCRGKEGTQALDRLKTRLLGPQSQGQFVVVQSLPGGAVALPGAITLLDRQIIERHDDVAVTAGYLIAANTGLARHDPLDSLLRFAGPRDTFTLFTTGDLPAGVLENYARAIAQNGGTQRDAQDLVAAFDTAQVPATPYAAFTGFPALLNNDPVAGQDFPMILTDSDWVKLQGICTI